MLTILTWNPLQHLILLKNHCLFLITASTCSLISFALCLPNCFKSADNTVVGGVLFHSKEKGSPKIHTYLRKKMKNRSQKGLKTWSLINKLYTKHGNKYVSSLTSSSERNKRIKEKREEREGLDRRGKEIACPGSSINPTNRVSRILDIQGFAGIPFNR